MWRFQIHALSSFEIYAYCYEVLTVDIILSRLPQRLHSSIYNLLLYDSPWVLLLSFDPTGFTFLLDFHEFDFFFIWDSMCKWGHEVHTWRIHLGSVLQAGPHCYKLQDFLPLKGWVYSIRFIHSFFLICTSMDVYSGWFQILAIASSAGGARRFFCILVSFHMDAQPEGGLLGHE